MLDRIEDNPPPEGARTRSRVALVGVAACGLASLALPALAYIGPGAGFALLGSFMVILVTIVAAFLAILVWPIRKLWRLLRRKKRDRPWARRLIVVGLDGQEPKLTDRFMAEGKLPNFKKLADQGCYHRLRTTFPSVSPVAWSSFSTGTHPAKHNIYDFLDRDRRTYLPLLSSTEIGKVERFLHLGRFRLPLHRPELRLLRKSKPFWTILGEYHVWSTVLRVPITFPPDRFYGAELSAMCAPDLLGTQGTFLLFTTRSESHRFKEGGMRIHLAKDGVPASSNLFSTRIEGPPNMFLAGEPPLTVPLQFELDRAAQKVRVQAGEERVELEPGKLSDWVSLTFPAAPLIKVSGICRMQVTELGEHFSLYVTPISFDPENPAMPISHPSYYATYLAKKIGPFNTLGLAEDTWALNEGVVDDGTFLAQTWSIDAERRAMFFAALERLREGTLSCVFDATDRIQHMFWRYLEADHPAAAAAGPTPQHQDAIADLYRKNDELVGQVLAQLRDGDVLMVISDHGFTSFRRGINLNAWLHAEGYLTLKEGATGTHEWLREVDWSKTRAYALGLTGMFLNLSGREAQGIVPPGAAAQALKDELVARLSGLQDETGEVGINEVFDTSKLYQGPYLGNAPDLLIGYNAGYRTSWDCATGVVAGPVFADNTKAWSGDHCVDPRLVPGVFFCNHPIDSADPALIDIAPTALRLFGVTPPAHMDGKTLFHRAPHHPNPQNGHATPE